MSFFRWGRLTAGEGDSSMSFWWCRWTEQSRSPRQTTLPASSARIWTSMCRAGWTYFSMYTEPSPKAASPSATARA